MFFPQVLIFFISCILPFPTFIYWITYSSSSRTSYRLLKSLCNFQNGMANYWGLIMCQNVLWHLQVLIPFNPHKNLVKWVLLLSSFYRKGNWLTERFSNMPKVTNLGAAKQGQEFRWSDSGAIFLTLSHATSLPSCDVQKIINKIVYVASEFLSGKFLLWCIFPHHLLMLIPFTEYDHTK